MHLAKILRAALAVAVLNAPLPAAAGEFDGSKPLLCDTVDGLEYHRNGIQKPFNPQSVGLPTAFVIDFKEKWIRPTSDSVVRKQTKIKHMEQVEDKLVLQGADEGIEGVDDGVGWTMSIMHESGRFAITASGADVGYIVFGTCRSESP